MYRFYLSFSNVSRNPILLNTSYIGQCRFGRLPVMFFSFRTSITVFTKIAIFSKPLDQVANFQVKCNTNSLLGSESFLTSSTKESRLRRAVKAVTSRKIIAEKHDELLFTTVSYDERNELQWMC